MNVTNNGKFALLLLLTLSKTSADVLSSSSMRVHSIIIKERETHMGNMLYLLKYVIFSIIYVIIFIKLCYHIYLFLNSNGDKNNMQNIRSVKLQTTAKTLINKRKTSELFNIPKFCFIFSLYS